PYALSTFSSTYRLSAGKCFFVGNVRVTKLPEKAVQTSHSSRQKSRTQVLGTSDQIDPHPGAPSRNEKAANHARIRFHPDSRSNRRFDLSPITGWFKFIRPASC